MGIATRIPPHNLSEVVSAAKALISNPSTSNEALHEHVLGPDFPTGGLLLAGPGIKSTYATGRGSMGLRSTLSIERGNGKSNRDVIAVTELPYQVYKADVIAEIAKLVDDGKLDGISDIQACSCLFVCVQLIAWNAMCSAVSGLVAPARWLHFALRMGRCFRLHCLLHCHDRHLLEYL